MRKYLIYVLLLLLVMVMISAFYGWQHRYEYARLWITPPPIEEVAAIPTVKSEQCVQVVYLPKSAAVKENLVPEHIKKDDNKQVTASIEVPAHEAVTVVSSVFDLSSGVNELSYRQERPGFMGFEHTKELGLRYGAGPIGTAWAIYGRYTFFRIGPLKTALYGEMNSGGSDGVEALAMLGVRGEWE